MTRKHIPNNRWAAETFLGKRTIRRVCNNTWVEKDSINGALYLRFHRTRIVKWYTDGTGLIGLNTGGWETATTKDRINRAAPIRIFSKRGKLFFILNTIEYEFHDGMIIYPDGSTNATVSNSNVLDGFRVTKGGKIEKTYRRKGPRQPLTITCDC
jgi:hypothetical protein